MHIIKSFIKGGAKTIRQNDDDFSDKLSYRATPFILLTFAVFVTGHSFIDKQIVCWCPSHFTGIQDDYVNDYCWVSNTYPLKWGDEVPDEDDTERRRPIPYYQWVGLILIAEACFFYAPIAVWRALNGRIGLDLNDIIEKSELLTRRGHKEKTQVDACLNYLVLVMNRYFVFKKRRASYLVLLYAFIKFLFLANCIGQLFLMNFFLGSNFNMYGIEVLRTIWAGKHWTGTVRFPRVTMCDVKVRSLGNLHRYTVQCALPANLYNEKIFLFLWFWIVMVAIVTVYRTLIWMVVVLDRRSRHRYIKRILHFKLSKDREEDKWRREDANVMAKFVDNHLKHDGQFILKFIEQNTDDVTVHDVVYALWKKYTEKKASAPVDSETVPLRLTSEEDIDGPKETVK